MYKILNEQFVVRISDGVNFPKSDIVYVEWLSQGNTPTPADVPPVPRITSVTMRQARLALLGAGMLSTVNNMLAGMAGAQGEAARIEWEYSQEVHRDRGLVQALRTKLGMTEAQLDALFTAAAAIP